ncbi:uncharacterized protein LOC133741874 [Rosa rugosa]|uniref:uncharacterized protein LOC133741874 n=1 Tax=Rosa rugosa TaxID=74645 RepID=UPI002B40B672|nr:uncharacterized protein LOC133741874 [Rosa rugosa]XP_062025574.1 uncharacterized protein LOC133741874 [Rosa rugosa]XP_062025575.1 uncharacterized protein LOC133741874 [Rosa rugosa]
MAQGRGKRIRKVQKVPPPQQPATTTMADNVSARPTVRETVPAMPLTDNAFATPTVRENVLATTTVHAHVSHVRARANTPPRANLPPQTNVPLPANVDPSIHQLPTQQEIPFVGIGMKRKRGKSCGKALQELIKANGGPLRVDFHRTIHVLSDDTISKMFTSEIGITVRGGAPVCKYGWSDIDEEDDKRLLREELRVFFMVDLTDPAVVAYVDSKMSTAYSQFKTRLKKEWKAFGSPELGRANLPSADLWNERPVSHWHWLCDNIYTNQSCIEIAEKNSANRYMQQHTHRAGARPYVQHALVASKGGKELSLIQNWGEKHKDNNHEWINEAAKNKYEKMEAERNALLEKMYQEAPEGTAHDSIKLTLEVEYPIMAKKLGRKGRMIHGIGNVPHIRSNIRRVSAWGGNNSEVAELRDLIDQLTFNMLNMKEQNGLLKAQMEYLLRQSPGQMSEDDFPHPSTNC